MVLLSYILTEKCFYSRLSLQKMFYSCLSLLKKLLSSSIPTENVLSLVFLQENATMVLKIYYMYRNNGRLFPTGKGTLEGGGGGSASNYLHCPGLLKYIYCTPGSKLIICKYSQRTPADRPWVGKSSLFITI